VISKQILVVLVIVDGWKMLQTKKPPAARHTHTVTVCSDMIYLFGGIDSVGKRFGDLHELDPGSHSSHSSHFIDFIHIDILFVLFSESRVGRDKNR
jgi:hypothetical protein